MANEVTEIICQHCGTAFVRPTVYVVGQRRHNPRACSYCSRDCVREAKKKCARVERPCRACGKTIWAYASQSGISKSDRHFCSMECRKARSVSACENCGKSFTHLRCISRRFCSLVCAGTRAIREHRKCAHCGKEYSVVPSQADGSKYCSRLCHNRAKGEARRLPTFTERKARLNKSGWRQLRADVITRDGGKCTRCESTEDLTVHHKARWVESRDDSPENLVTLCRSCHYIVEHLPRIREGKWARR